MYVSYFLIESQVATTLKDSAPSSSLLETLRLPFASFAGITLYLVSKQILPSYLNYNLVAGKQVRLPLDIKMHLSGANSKIHTFLRNQRIEYRRYIR